MESRVTPGRMISEDERRGKEGQLEKKEGDGEERKRDEPVRGGVTISRPPSGFSKTTNMFCWERG